MEYKYSTDDYCDIYENKICDNCGKCLEAEGVDIRAIKIEDISKTVEENKALEESFINKLKDYKDEVLEDSEADNMDEDELVMEAYKKFEEENNIDLSSEDYEDAFEHIEYLDEDIFNENDLEEITEEIFPGVRKIKRK